MGDDAADDTKLAGKPSKPAKKPTKVSKNGSMKKVKSARRLMLDEYTQFKNLRRSLATDEGKTIQPAPSADDDDASNNDDLAIFRNFVFGKCMVDGKEATPSSIPLTPTPPPKPANKINTDN